MLARQYDEIGWFQEDKFPNQTSQAKVKHLAKEVQELLADIEANDPNKLMELADCFILLAAIAHKEEISFLDLIRAIDCKMSQNKLRDWGKPDEDGVVEHVEQDDAKSLNIDEAYDYAMNGYKIHHSSFAQSDYLYFKNGWYNSYNQFVVFERYRIDKNMRTGWYALPFNTEKQFPK